MESCMGALDLEYYLGRLLEKPAISAEQRYKTEQKIRKQYRDATEQLLRSLSFKEMSAREQSIERPTDSTCQWIYQDPKYKFWSDNAKPLLWIKGEIRSI